MVNNLYKLAISGKANSGKNTVSTFLMNGIKDKLAENFNGSKCIAFADPIKEMARLMFPDIPKKFFFGSSKYRSEIIPRSFKNGQPLTVRQILIDLGTNIGRGYKDSIWLEVFDHHFEKMNNKHYSLIIVPDVRFRNEFEHLKEKGFYQIRLKRNDHLKIDDVSETNQDSIEDSEFDCLLNNNSTIDNLKTDVDKIINILL